MQRSEILNLLRKMGYVNVPSAKWYETVDLWRGWYEGKTAFHSYKVFNGHSRIGCTRQSLGIAKKMCEDKADLLLNERVEILTDRQDELDAVLARNNFWVRGNQLVETAHAVGTGAFVEYLDNGEVAIDYVAAENIFPLSWRNGDITECAFASEVTDARGRLTYINLHTINERGEYEVRNLLFDKDGKPAPLPDGVAEVWQTRSALPMYQIVTPNAANNVQRGVPMGVSVYAGSIDLLQTIDLIYDSYHNEFQLGKKRIFVDATLVTMGDSGTPVFDRNDTVFYGVPYFGEDSNKPIQESNMQLRAEEHQTALQSCLDLLSEMAGFGKGYYRFDAETAQTATAVISQNSKLYRRIKKDELVLKHALTGLVRAVLFLEGHDPSADVSISFDDSIIEDTDAKARRALIELQAGIIDTIEYFVRVYDMSEDAAAEKAQAIAARRPALGEVEF